MKVNKDKQIKRAPLLDCYIQRVLGEKMQEIEEIKIAQAIRALLNEEEIEPKNLN